MRVCARRDLDRCELRDEIGLRHLAHRVARQLDIGAQEGWHLVGREPLLAESSQFVEREAMAFVQHDGGGDALAPYVIGHADHSAFLDRRVLAQRLLDVERRDLEAAGLEDVDRLAAEEAIHAALDESPRRR